MTRGEDSLQSWQLFICSRARVLLILRSPAHFHNYQDLTNQMAAFRPSTGSARAFKLMLVIIEYTGVRVRSSKCQNSKWFGYWSKRIKFRDYKILMPTLNNDWIRQMEIEIKVQHSRTTKIRKLKVGIKI